MMAAGPRPARARRPGATGPLLAANASLLIHSAARGGQVMRGRRGVAGRIPPEQCAIVLHRVQHGVVRGGGLQSEGVHQGEQSRCLILGAGREPRGSASYGQVRSPLPRLGLRRARMWPTRHRARHCALFASRRVRGSNPLSSCRQVRIHGHDRRTSLPCSDVRFWERIRSRSWFPPHLDRCAVGCSGDGLVG